MSAGPVQVPADCYIIVYQCTDECGGQYQLLPGTASMDLHPTPEEMVEAGTIDPVLWRHRCDKCGAQLKLAEKYPKPAFIQRKQG
jgi:hypothetical protein